MEIVEPWREEHEKLVIWYLGKPSLKYTNSCGEKFKTIPDITTVLLLWFWRYIQKWSQDESKGRQPPGQVLAGHGPHFCCRRFPFHSKLDPHWIPILKNLGPHSMWEQCKGRQDMSVSPCRLPAPTLALVMAMPNSIIINTAIIILNYHSWLSSIIVTGITMILCSRIPIMVVAWLHACFFLRHNATSLAQPVSVLHILGRG